VLNIYVRWVYILSIVIWWYYAVGVSSNGITFIPNFVKICALIQNLKGVALLRAHTHSLMIS